MVAVDTATTGTELRYEESPGSAQWEGTISAYDLTRSLIDSLKTLFELRNLPPNWDSYGSPPPTSEASSSASQILQITSSMENIPPPHVIPISGGGIQINWRKRNRELDIEILQNGNIEFLKSVDDNSMEEGELVANSREFYETFGWLNNYEG